MTKRFKDIEVSADTGEVRLYTNDTDYEEYASEQLLELINTIYDLVNNQNEQMQELEEEKERYKRLSEIRNEQINNRILTIREFIDNCSNEDIKNALQDLFYSEVNEYDLAKKNRVLCSENERMTNKLNELALELLNYDMITMGKATEISEMSYHDFLKYRKEKGNPMELTL